MIFDMVEFYHIYVYLWKAKQRGQRSLGFFISMYIYVYLWLSMYIYVYLCISMQCISQIISEFWPENWTCRVFDWWFWTQLMIKPNVFFCFFTFYTIPIRILCLHHQTSIIDDDSFYDSYPTNHIPANLSSHIIIYDLYYKLLEIIVVSPWSTLYNHNS